MINYKIFRGIILLMILMFISCDDILEVPDISDENVVILAPTEGSIINTNDVSFNWQTLEDAKSYQLQIASPNFAEATQIVADTTLNGTIFSINLDAGIYEWRVKAQNSGFETTYTTAGFSVE